MTPQGDLNMHTSEQNEPHKPLAQDTGGEPPASRRRFGPLDILMIVILTVVAFKALWIFGRLGYQLLTGP